MGSASEHLPKNQHDHQTPSPGTAQGLGLGRAPRLGDAPLLPTSHGVSSSSQPRKASSEPWGPAAGPTLAPALGVKLTSRNEGLSPMWGSVWDPGRDQQLQGWVVPPGNRTWDVDEASLEAPAFFSRCPNQPGDTPLCPQSAPAAFCFQTPTPWT